MSFGPLGLPPDFRDLRPFLHPANIRSLVPSLESGLRVCAIKHTVDRLQTLGWVWLRHWSPGRRCIERRLAG